MEKHVGGAHEYKWSGVPSLHAMGQALQAGLKKINNTREELLRKGNELTIA